MSTALKLTGSTSTEDHINQFAFTFGVVFGFVLVAVFKLRLARKAGA